ncbi:MAG: hypothetical protein ACHQ4H_02465 [Ktedonobacterales bacterium]
MSQSQQSGSGATPSPQLADAATIRYLGYSHEELIEVQIEAWALGGACAQRDGPRASRELAAVEQRAELACEETLENCVPMDLTRFHDVFTLAWVAGYCVVRRAGGR